MAAKEIDRWEVSPTAPPEVRRLLKRLVKRAAHHAWGWYPTVNPGGAYEGSDGLHAALRDVGRETGWLRWVAHCERCGEETDSPRRDMTIFLADSLCPACYAAYRAARQERERRENEERAADRRAREATVQALKLAAASVEHTNLRAWRGIMDQLDDVTRGHQ